jgi:hypothetical protein
LYSRVTDYQTLINPGGWASIEYFAIARFHDYIPVIGRTARFSQLKPLPDSVPGPR